MTPSDHGMVRMVTSEDKQFYSENGYVVLKDVFSKEDLDDLSSDYDDMFERAQERSLPTSSYEN